MCEREKEREKQTERLKENEREREMRKTVLNGFCEQKVFRSDHSMLVSYFFVASMIKV